MENVMSGKVKVLALAFVLALVCVGIVVPAPAAAGITSLELVPGKYTGDTVYVPGEAMSIILTGNIVNETFSLYKVINGEESVIGGQITIPPTGIVKVSYDIPLSMPDGNYMIRVKRANGAMEAEAGFSVKGYTFNIETDRSAYLSGDEMRVFWTANNLKDQTLPASGAGKIEVWEQNPTDLSIRRRILPPHTFNTSAGSVSFKLPEPTYVNYSMKYYVDGWFNSSIMNPERMQYSYANFSIKWLGAIINLDKDQYTADSLLRMSVMTIATNNPANPTSPYTAVPECDVRITVKKIGTTNPVYNNLLKTDSQGFLKNIIALTDSTYVDGSVFEVEIYASKGLNSFSDIQPFEIVSSSSISIVLDFNRAQYASGETLFVNATASAIGDTTSAAFTYILEIRAINSTGSLFARDTQLHGNFSFKIPSNFEGLLWVKVTADDGAGNSASVTQNVRVAYAIVLVNVGKNYYNPNDVLSVTYDIIGNMEGELETFYIVYDNDGNVVEEGIITQDKFNFNVPAAPSSNYAFTVFASAGGRVIQGTGRASLYAGFLLNLEFNRGYYGPGDIIAVDYDIIALGNSNMPASFTITYGLVNGPVSSLQTTQTSGTLLYTVPKDIDQGEQLFMAVCDFGATQASASEILIVRSNANPLWNLRISDIPVFSIIVLLLALFSIYLSLKTRKKVKAIEQGDSYKAGPVDSLIAKRAQEIDTHLVECVECGNPIEITTTRRPIEVMCPHCGEIQHIE